MSAFYKHYAKINDDIRTELIDRAWFNRKFGDNAFEQQFGNAPSPSQEPIQQHAREPVSERAAVYGHDPNMPDSLQGVGIYGNAEANPGSQKAAIETFYGVRQTPQGDEMGYQSETERWEAGLQDQLNVEEHESVYGRNIYREDDKPQQDIHGNGAMKDQYQAFYGHDSLYGYDALDEPEQNFYGRDDREPEL